MPRKRFFPEREGSYSQVYAKDNQNEDHLVFLDDISNSSNTSYSSADRSSIGSIPWADDAIKKNQLDWEQVEKLLSGEEFIIDIEPELQNEIIEWQRKFPQLLRSTRAGTSKQNKLDSVPELNLDDSLLDLDSISNSISSLNSLDEEDSFDQVMVKKFNSANVQNKRTDSIPTKMSFHHQQDKGLNAVSHLFEQGFHISSLPLMSRKHRAGQSTVKPTESIMSVQSIRGTPLGNTRVLPIKSTLARGNNVGRTATGTLPVLNELASKRIVRVIPNSLSFVQLTQIQQVKSAAIATENQYRRSYAKQTSSGGDYSYSYNNRNSIVLPALKTQRARDSSISPTTISRGTSNAFSKSCRNRNSFKLFESRRHNANLQLDVTRITSTTSTVTPSTGRSISAAAHHYQPIKLRSLYAPCSASKFEVIN